MAWTQNERERAWKWWVEHRHPDLNTPCKFTKADLRTAADAVEAWQVAETTSFLAALAGTPFAGAAATTDEKIRLLISVVIGKYEVEL